MTAEEPQFLQGTTPVWWGMADFSLRHGRALSGALSAGQATVQTAAVVALEQQAGDVETAGKHQIQQHGGRGQP